MNKKPGILPFRVAQPRFQELSHLTDEYLQMLVRCGYDGVYLQNSPFDRFNDSFYGCYGDYHLISLYDIARGPEIARYQDYINNVCERLNAFGLNTYFNMWEPRLPVTAWAKTPLEWRGRGSWSPNTGKNFTSFCWGQPDAVAYWKQMCLDAFDAMPDIKGIHIGINDNEALLCHESCPRCKGQTQKQAYRDIFSTLMKVREKRGGDFRITLYSWLQDNELLEEATRQINDPDTYLIGRSSQGHKQVIEGQKIEGAIGDMTMVTGHCGPRMEKHKAVADQLNIKLVDMVAWSRGMENWWLPAPPDPGFAWEKMTSLHKIGAQGWYDFDCGALEPGSISEMVALLTEDPARERDEAIESVISKLFPADTATALEAYRLYAEGKQYFPIALSPKSSRSLSLKALGLGLVLFGPVIPEDLKFMELRADPRTHFAPFFFFTEETIETYHRCFPRGRDILAKAFETISACPAETPLAQREKDAFEIHYRHFRALANYAQFAQAQFNHSRGKLSDEGYRKHIVTVAEDELDNTRALGKWIDRNPHTLGNPCWHLIGKLEDCWPGIHFQDTGLQAKVESLHALIENRQPIFKGADTHQLAKWLPAYGQVKSPKYASLTAQI